MLFYCRCFHSNNLLVYVKPLLTQSCHSNKVLYLHKGACFIVTIVTRDGYMLLYLYCSRCVAMAIVCYVDLIISLQTFTVTINILQKKIIYIVVMPISDFLLKISEIRNYSCCHSNNKCYCIADFTIVLP